MLLAGSVILASSCSVIRDVAGFAWGGSSGGRPGKDCYTQFGERYCPMVSAEGFVETGIASWYGEKFHGRPTALGVRVEALEPGGSPEPAIAGGAHAYIQAGAFAFRDNAVKLYQRIRQAGITGVYVRRKGNGVYAVWVGPLGNDREFGRLEGRLAALGIARTMRVSGNAPPG